MGGSMGCRGGRCEGMSETQTSVVESDVMGGWVMGVAETGRGRECVCRACPWQTAGEGESAC